MNKHESTDPLRQLVSELRPRRPEDVMGEAASNSLYRSIGASAVAGLACLLGSTALLFALGITPATKPATTAESAPASANATASQPDAESKPAGDEDSSTGADPAEQPPADPDSAVEAMGIGDVKDPDADADSLDDRLDKILDGLE